MSYARDIALTALAPAIWGSSYIVATEFLPLIDPLIVSLLRALPAGIILLIIVKELPKGWWIAKIFLLGALNFSIFWTMLFIAAYRLPGGVAAVVGSLQPFIVIFAARLIIGTPIKLLSIVAVMAGMLGVALLILTPKASLDLFGIGAALIGSASMALGTVMSKKWQPPVPPLTFTAWQLTAGGILLLPTLLLVEGQWSDFSLTNFAGIAYLGLIGAAFTYLLWFRGIARLNPSSVAILGILSPLVATLLGWFILGESLSALQLFGVGIVLVSVIAGQYALRPNRVVLKPAMSK
ncbi:DMT family transporter [Ahrensia kielensis]|uniref:DMT family transporter n=1 Tax=Ahrensia kielensis TaxID=76980 RepID=UPI000367A6EA|nr:EamA family transporter [Ahrensia kielensis]